MVLALSQSADPHRQLVASSFADVPFVILQDEVGREQVLVAAVQTMPVPLPSPLLVQALLPQMQALSLLGADPSVILQAGAVRVQMHVEKVEQDDLEEVSLLKYREPIEPS